MQAELDLELMGDIVVPIASILISTLIALFALRVQQGSARRDRTNAAKGQVMAALNEMEIEGIRRHEEKPHDLDAAVQRFDGAIFQLRMVLPRRQLPIASFIRDEIIVEHISGDDTWTYVSKVSTVRNVLVDWSAGALSTRRILQLTRWLGLDTYYASPFSLRWQTIIDEGEAAAGTSDHGQVWAGYKKRVIRKLRRRARVGRTLRNSIANLAYRWRVDHRSIVESRPADDRH